MFLEFQHLTSTSEDSWMESFGRKQKERINFWFLN